MLHKTLAIHTLHHMELEPPSLLYETYDMYRKNSNRDITLKSEQTFKKSAVKWTSYFEQKS